VSPRVVVVSDSHFSARTPEADRNWDAVVRHVGNLRPDLVIHVGDVSVDGTREPDELRLAREQLDRLPVDWLAVPGNHDVGDNPVDTASEFDVTPDRLVRWSEAFGPDRWSRDLGDWRLVGVNAQLFGTGGPE
jgi:3',5'-cyclic AMP phosphodiesterase CpdA